MIFLYDHKAIKKEGINSNEKTINSTPILKEIKKAEIIEAIIPPNSIII